MPRNVNRGQPPSFHSAAPAHRLEPEIADTPAVARQVVEAVEAVEMVDEKVRHRLRWREPDIDRDTATTVRLKAPAAPAQHAAAGGAEVDLERRIGLARTGIGSARPRDADALVLVVISPERAVATA